jgi:nucleoside-diphosphate-sugar epimerase
MTQGFVSTSFVLPSEDLQSVLSRTLPVWEQLRGGRLFVTGGTGFFGKWLLETFAFANAELQLEAELVALTRDPQRFLLEMPHLAEWDSIRFQTGDVRNFVFPDGTFTHVIHAATEASAALNEQSPRKMFNVIVDGTRRVLEFCERCGAEKLLLASSGAVYGKQPVGMTHVGEDFAGGPDPLSQTAAYAEGKRVAEMLCADAHSRRDLKTSIARCFAFVGPFLPLDRHFAIGNFLRDALKGGPVVVRSAGRDYRSYLYAADLTAWLWTILLQGESCRAYNVGSDEAISIANVARSVASLAGCGLEIRGDELVNSNPASHYVPSIDRARDELGLTIATDFHTAIKRTFNWHECRRGSAA